MDQCHGRFRLNSLFALFIALASLNAAGCAGSPAAPPSQEAQEPADPRQAWNPFVVSDPGGRIFVTYFGGLGGDEYRLLFTRSLDGGATWLHEPIQLDTPPPPNARYGFHRLETNGAGMVSVIWSIEQKEGTFWRVRELRHRHSFDSGTSWTEEPLRWRFDAQSIYQSARTDRDGEMLLLFTDGPIARAVPRFIRSTGRGNTWAPAPVTLPGTNEAIPSATGEQQGASGARAAHWPALATDRRGALYAVWQENSRHGGAAILFNRSQDGGSTWLDASLQLNTSKGTTSRIPVIAADGSEGIYVVWQDFRHNTTDLFFNRSLDGGATWLDQDVWITADRPQIAAAAYPILSADRTGHLYLLWSDIREGPYSLFFNRSLDRGTNWLPHPIRVDHRDPKEITYAHRLASDDAGHIYAVWWQGQPDTKGTLRFNRSDDYGATWLEKEQILDTGLGKEGPRFAWLSIDRQGGVHVVWSSDRTGRYQLFLNRSTDHGKTWLLHDIQITGKSVKATRRS